MMTEKDYLAFCQKQVEGPLQEEDLVTMLTAWGAINYSLGYKTALADHNMEPKDKPAKDKGDAL